MEVWHNSFSMIPVLLLLFSSLSQSTIIGDRIDYRKINLSSIPDENLKENDAKSITKFVFSHNAIVYLQQSDFDHLYSFPNIRYLFLDNNKIKKIYDGGFSRLTNLEHVDLSHNELTGISDALKVDLQKLPSLKYINLKRNPIEDFNNIYGLMEDGIDIDFDGMSGVNRKRSLMGETNGTNIVKDHEVLHHDHENRTITDKPRKAFVRDNKHLTTVRDEKALLDSKFHNSIVFNFIAAGLVLVALPVGMVVYYLFNKNRQLYS